jgi:hypothetical protein
VSAVPSDEIRHDASTDAICEYAPCAIPFKRKRRWQRFCSDEHKHAYHDPDNQRIAGVVKSIRPLKGGKCSVTLHFDSVEAALRLEPGKIAEVL